MKSTLILISIFLSLSHFKSQTGKLIRLPSDISQYDTVISYFGTERILGLGESSHLNKTIIDYKANFVKRLHERHSFTVLAWEGSLLSAFNAFYYSNNDSIAMIESTYPVWYNRSVRGLFKYIQDSKSTKRPLESCGFDLKGNIGYNTSYWTADILKYIGSQLSKDFFKRDSLLTTHIKKWEYKLKRLHPDSAKAYTMFYKKTIDTVRYSKMKLLSAGIDEKKFEVLIRGLMNRSAVVNFLAIKESSNWMKYRDSIMTENIEWLANQHYANQKIILWAANLHISKAGSTIYKNNNFKSAVEGLADLTKKEIISLGIAPSGQAPRELKSKINRDGNYLYLPDKPLNGLDAIIYLSSKN